VDLNGDGLTDLVYGVTQSGFGTPDTIYYRINGGSSFGAEQVLQTYTNGFGCSPCVKLNSFGATQVRFQSRGHKTDFNGDGREDFLIKVRTCDPDSGAPGKCGDANDPIITYYQAFISKADGTYGAFDSFHFGGGTGSGWPLVGDFNGDGCSDVAAI